MEQNENKRQGTLSMLIIALFGVMIGLLLSPGRKASMHEVQGLTKLDNVMDLIEHFYVENYDRDSLTETMIQSMLSNLDPHSRYLSAEELLREQESLQGEFEGIGILLHYQGDTACVNEVIPGGPAEKAGFQPGDRLMKVDDTPIAGVGMNPEEVVKHLRGPSRSKADITIKRHGEEGQRHLKVVRGHISTPSITYSGMLDQTTGYIRLTRFCETTYDEFCKAITSLKKEGMKNLIFDLRDNGGGLLTAAVAIADDFLPGKELIVYTQGDHQRRENLRSEKGGLFSEGKLAILVNEYSASASEIVAGAVQDNDRGIIIGRRTFGKGLVQRQFSLPDASAVWLTTARYYTPSGRCIQRPYDKGTDEYYSDFLTSVLENMESDTLLTKITDTTKYYTTKGKVVYGGGGIYPDYPLHLFSDTLLIYYNQLFGKQYFGQVAFDYVTANYPQLKKQYKTEDDFVKNFQVSDALFNKVIAMGEKDGIKRDSRSIAKYGAEMRSHIKAAIAQSLFRSESYYRVVLLNDREIQDAFKIIKKVK